MSDYQLTLEQKRWKQLWPVGCLALLATIQLLLTFSIIGLEIASMITDLYHSMIFAGYYCSLFFMITWISMFTVTCCNQHSMGCAIHVLVENILSIIASLILISFDSLFIHNPYTCLYASDDNCNRSSSSSSGIYDSTFYTIKMGVIKTQLACTITIFLTNIIYIAIYIYVIIKSRSDMSTIEPQMCDVQKSSIDTDQPIINREVTYTKQRSTLECPHCHKLVLIV